MGFRRLLIAIFGLVLMSPAVSAKFLSDADLPPSGVNCCDWDYVIPNEGNLGEAKNLLRLASEGVYVSVGTERGFMGAAITPTATHLLLVDVDRKVVAFNQINIALLKLAQNTSDYFKLRYESKFEVWKSRVEAAGLENDPEVEILTQYHVWLWWNRRVKQYNTEFALLFKAPPPQKKIKGTTYMYEGANYLHDSKLFARLHAMALAGHMQAIQLNLKDVQAIEMTANAIKKAGLTVGVLDLSNAWQIEYIGLIFTYKIVEAFRVCANNFTFLLLTRRLPDNAYVMQWGKPKAVYYKSILPWMKRFVSNYKLTEIVDYGFNIAEPRMNNHVAPKWSYQAYTFGYLGEDIANYPSGAPWKLENHLRLNPKE